MANYLLDTGTFLWMSLEPERLSREVRTICVDPGRTLFLNAISVWEVDLNYRLGRLRLDTEPAEFIPQQRTAMSVYALPFDEGAALRQKALPDIHRDPFDRMLICQAMQHGLTLLTPDRHIHEYPVPVVW